MRHPRRLIPAALVVALMCTALGTGVSAYAETGTAGTSENEKLETGTAAPNEAGENLDQDPVGDPTAGTDALLTSDDPDAESNDSATPVVEQTPKEKADALAAAHVNDLADGAYTIATALRSDCVFDAAGGNTTAGTAVQLYSSNSTAAQVWTVTHAGNYVVIKSSKSGLALDVTSGSTANGTKVQLWDYNGTRAQLWIAVLLDDDSYEFRSAMDPSIVLDLAGANTSNGTRIQVYASNSTAAQHWNVETCLTPREKLDILAEDNVAALEDGATVSFVPSTATGVSLSTSSGSGKLASCNAHNLTKWTVSHDAKGYVTFTDSKGKVLDVSGGASANGTAIQSWASNGTYAQKWIAVANENGTFTIHSALSEKAVLDCSGGSLAAGTTVQIWTSNGTAAQTWSVVSSDYYSAQLDELAEQGAAALAEGEYYLIAGSVDSHMAFDVESGSKSNGANVRLWDSNASGAQKWRVTYDKQGYATITNVNSGLVLDVSGGNAASLSNIQQYSSNSSWAQKWIVCAKENGGYELLSALWPNLSFDVTNGNIAQGSNIRLYTSNGSAAQTFYAYETAPAAVEPGEQVIDYGWYEIASTTDTSLVVDIASGSLSSGANAQFYASNGTLAQAFSAEYSDGYYILRNAQSGLVLGLDSTSTVPGANVSQHSDETSDATYFVAIKNADGSFSFINKGTGLALEKSGSNLRVSDYDETSTDQQFFLSEKETLLTEGVYTIASAASASAVLDVANASFSDGANVQVASSDSSLAQRWYVKPVEGTDNLYTIESLISAGLLTMGDNGNVTVGTATGSRNQMWEAAVRPGGIELVAYGNPNKALDLAGGSTSSGTNVQVYDRNNSTAQRFRFSSTDATVPNGTYAIRFVASNSHVLDVSGASFTNGANVQAYSYNATTAQKWIVRRLSDGNYSFINVNSGRVLDVASGVAAEGTNVQQYGSNGTLAQEWVISYRSGGFRIVSAVDTDYVLCAGESVANGSNICLTSDADATSSAFIFQTVPYATGGVATVLNEASSHLGNVGGSFCKQWYAGITGNSYYAEDGVSWCAMFVSYVFNKAGISCPGLPNASCGQIYYGGKAAGILVDPKTAQAGDVVIFNWHYDDEGHDHVGIVQRNLGDEGLLTIEGNTSNTVAERTRDWYNVQYVLRPYY